jgi:hypothetical protein
VGYHTGASVLVENNYFLRSGNPLNQMYTSVPSAAHFANAKESGNIFDNTTGNKRGTGKSFDPGFYYDYQFALDSAIHIPSMIESLAGPAPGLEYEIYPTPGNGSIDVHTAADTLLWTNLENITTWEVYFGTDTTSLTKKTTTQRSYVPEGLTPGTTYFWKIHAIGQDTTIEGPLWRFRTAPEKASKPNPADGELHSSLRDPITETSTGPITLSWKPAFRASSFKVYFGTSRPLTESDYQKDVISPEFSPGPLAYGVKYYWRIKTVTSDGTVIEGDTWSFQSDVTYSQVGDTEVEHMVLNGRAFLEEQNGVWFNSSNDTVVSGEAGPGTMSSIWAGPDSIYTISVSYFDESDGTGWYGLYVNENRIDDWFASANNNTMITHTVEKVELNKGDELRIAFYTNGGELNRTDLMNVKFYKEVTGIDTRKAPVYPRNQELTLSIYSITGSLLTSYQVSSDENGKVRNLHLHEQQLPWGMYIYTIHGTNTPSSRGEIFLHENRYY